MCLGMNPDILAPGERCASTSNRNFEGRQGRGGRTHLVSPMMAAAAAVSGHFTDVRKWEFNRRRGSGSNEAISQTQIDGRCPSIARTSTPTRSSPSSSSSGSSAPAMANSFSSIGGIQEARRSTIRFHPEQPTTGRGDSGRGQELRLRILARTCRVGALRLRLSLRHRVVTSPTFFIPTQARTASCSSRCPRSRWSFCSSAPPRSTTTSSLSRLKIKLHDDHGFSATFSIDPFRR